MSMLNIYNTKVTNHWQTPPDLYNKLNTEFGFSSFDPCPLNRTDSTGNEINGLKQEWVSPCFVNPPYSNIEPWVKKAREQQLKGITSVFLIPSRTSTGYFHEYVLPYAEIRFLRGRVSFLDSKGESKGPAPFPSCACVFKGIKSD
jgi:site-specific DNA-methyltransferase (adenine-specific)